MNSLRKAAEELRAQGYSYNLINQKLGIPRSTMSYWFKDRPFTPNEEVLSRMKVGPSKAGIQHHKKRLQEIKDQKIKGINEVGQLSKRDLWLLGIGLYIGEGAKTTGIIRITNSDPNVIKLSIAWLKQVGNLSNNNFAIRLHLYPDNNHEEAMLYWQKVTGLGAENFRQPSIDRRTNKHVLSARKLLYGTAHLTVISKGDPEKGVRFFRRINGWIQGVVDQV